MIGKLNHIAIAVPNIIDSINQYKNTFGAKVTGVVDLVEHGVKTAFINLPNTNIELIEPLGNKSPIKKFIDNNTLGGIHHLCYEVDDIDSSLELLLKKKYKILGNGYPRPGAHGKNVIFLSPKQFNGTLIELEQK